MKKLITLFSFLAFSSLLFIGCQSEDIMAPDDLSKPGALVWGDPTPGALPYTVDLVAGQHNVVGTVKIERIVNDLKVTYTMSGMGAGGSISEVHVDLTYLPKDFHVNKNGNPTFGKFDSKNFSTISYNADNSEAYVYFTAAQLVSALGSAPSAGQKIYIAAHSGVCYPGGDEATAEICPDLTNAQGAKLLSGLGNYWTVQNPTHYMNTLRFDKTVVPGIEVFKGWCLDPERGSFDGDDIPHYTQRPLNFVCSTDETPFGTCLLDYPENLKQANWIINNRGNYSIEAVQYALWVLLAAHPDEGSLDGFKAEAVQLLATMPSDLSDWNPGCGDKVLVLVYDTTQDPCSEDLLQPIGIEVPVECELTCDTAMGFPYEPDGYSSLFPGHVWFRYIAFNY